MSTAAPPQPHAVPFTRSLSNATLDVADGVVGLRSYIVNVYFVRTPDDPSQWVLVDAGLPFSGPDIRAKAAELFGEGSRPLAVLMTHGHFDHVGVLKTLADEWDVPVYAHRLEAPYLNGTAPYAPPDPWVGGAMALASPLYPRGPVDVSDRLRVLPSGGAVPHLPGWRWIPTPGHSPGHVSFFRDGDRTLIAGDAFVTTRQEYFTAVLAQTQAVSGPPRYFTHDWQAAEASVKALNDLDIEVAATGHGTPMRGEVLREQLRALAADFRTREVPAKGRYAEAPVVADENGPEQVPPPRPVPAAAIAAGVGLAMLGVVGLLAASAVRAESRSGGVNE